jgi:hypothetical protein
VSVHSHDSLSPGHGYRVGRQASAQRLPAARSSVLPGIPEIWHNRRDMLGACAARSITQKQQLDKVLVNRRACRLNNKKVRSAHRLKDLDLLFAVRETLHFCR